VGTAVDVVIFLTLSRARLDGGVARGESRARDERPRETAPRAPRARSATLPELRGGLATAIPGPTNRVAATST